MIRPSLTALLFVLSTAASAQPARSDSAAAVAAVEAFHAALAAGDSAKAVGMLSDDVLIVESGAIQTRAQYLGGHLGADMRASQASKGEQRTVSAVTVIGDVAYIVARTTAPAAPPANATPPAAGTPPGNFVSEMAELMIVSRTATGWKIRAVHWSSRRRRA